MNNQTEEKKSLTKSELYDKHYKTILTIPVIIMVLSLAYLAYFYSQNGDIMLKDISLSGGSTITIQGDIDSNAIESAIKSQFPYISIRNLSDFRTGVSSINLRDLCPAR